MGELHWTYEASVGLASDLEQGDILAPTPELRELFLDVHRYFANDKYLGFIVTTQTCDLVRRNKRGCKAAHISIAPVRPLQQILPRLLATVCSQPVPGAFDVTHKEDARQLLERLFNQNEQAQGLFYLHPEGDAAFGDRAVAFLRVAFALKAEHYPLLLKARRGRLLPAFQAKLGWLVGNLYARPASPDWNDTDAGKSELNAMIDEYLESDPEHPSHVWVDAALVAAAKDQIDLAAIPLPALPAELDRFRPDPPLEQVLREIEKAVHNTLEGFRRKGALAPAEPAVPAVPPNTALPATSAVRADGSEPLESSAPTTTASPAPGAAASPTLLPDTLTTLKAALDAVEPELLLKLRGRLSSGVLKRYFAESTVGQLSLTKSTA